MAAERECCFISEGVRKICPGEGGSRPRSKFPALEPERGRGARDHLKRGRGARDHLLLDAPAKVVAGPWTAFSADRSSILQAFIWGFQRLAPHREALSLLMNSASKTS